MFRTDVPALLRFGALLDTDPTALLALAVFAVPFVGFWLIGRQVPELGPTRSSRRRLATAHQAVEPAPGTGVERNGRSVPVAAVLADTALPRSPQAAVDAVAPRPAASTAFHSSAVAWR